MNITMVGILTLALLSVSCSKQQDEARGRLSFSVVPDGQVTEVTRSLVSDYTTLPQIGKFTIVVTGNNGNAGSTSVGSQYAICYPDASDFKEGSQSVCLQSRNVIVKFAAGNLFSGHFGETIGTKGGTVFFGRPFTARPTALRLWVKYTGGIIDCAESGVPDEGKKGNYDKASIKVALGVWNYRKYGGDPDSPVKVNTTDVSTFVDYNTDESTIASGERIIPSDGSNPAKDWIQVTIPIDYRNKTTYPTHIIISCAASMYGDYFSGHDGSKLWIDGMELIYE